MTALTDRVRIFAGVTKVKRCRHKHRLQGTGAVFYQSVGLLQCSMCKGWALIKKPIR